MNKLYKIENETKMTLESVLRCLPELKQLSKTKSRAKRLKILKKSKKCLYYAISEIARNLVKGNIPISQQRLKKLIQHRNKIRNLAKKTLTLKKRKAITHQIGGFLPQLLIPALSVLGNIIIDRIRK